jgi:cell division protein FtsB
VAGRPSRPAPAPRPTRTRRLVVLGGVLVVLAVLLAPALRSYVGQRGDIAALEQKVADQRAAVAGLERQRAAWDDPAYVTAQARNRLKFVLPGEKAYTVIDPGPEPTSAAGQVKAAVRTARQDRSWFGNLWGSLEVVGRGEQIPGR